MRYIDEVIYPYEYKDLPASSVMCRDDAKGFVEGYAMALADIMLRLTGDSPCDKSYDPMQVGREGGKFHSYAFDMKDGGRHHPISDYKDIGEVCEVLLNESVEWVNEDEV
jgi:hypothetical protein